MGGALLPLIPPFFLAKYPLCAFLLKTNKCDPSCFSNIARKPYTARFEAQFGFPARMRGIVGWHFGVEGGVSRRKPSAPYHWGKFTNSRTSRLSITNNLLDCEFRKLLNFRQIIGLIL